MVNEVETLLNNESVHFIPSGRDYLIRCLNPDHEDRPQSTGLKIPQKSIPILSSYRGISLKTLKEFEAFTHNLEFPGRIVFPMRSSSGKIVAFNARATEPGVEPRYEIYPRGVTLSMYPGSINPINGSIFIVEGIFDFLNVYDKGLTNSVALLGVTTLHDKKGLNKEKVAQFKLSGVTKIYLMLDGDTAGRKAMEELKPLLEAADFYVEIIDLEDDTDPGDLGSEDVKILINKVKGRHT